MGHRTGWAALARWASGWRWWWVPWCGKASVGSALARPSTAAMEHRCRWGGSNVPSVLLAAFEGQLGQGW